MPKRKPAAPTARVLREQLRVAELSLALEETRYATGMLQRLGEDSSTSGAVVRDDTTEERGKWSVVSSGSSVLTDKEGTRDPATVRRECYRAWRQDSYARGILRTFVKFIIGRGWGMDFADLRRGQWVGTPGSQTLKETGNGDDPLLIELAWDAFAARVKFIQRAKEIVLRAFRDGEAFVRRFDTPGGPVLRFVEPGGVQSAQQTGAVTAEDASRNPELADLVGKPTTIQDGIEHLKDDVESVIAYHVDGARVPAPEIEHVKPLADSNDLRGIPLLEVVLKRLTNYAQWEEYRLILNKVRTAVAFVRKIEGTSAQATSLLAGRASPRSAPGGREPQTTGGVRETMFRPGSVLTAHPGVSYEFLNAKLDAADAGEDGRRFLLSIAVGVGLPEMLVTADWRNNNFASSVTARDPAVREWEDWQDFFEPTFQRIFTWGLDDAVARLGLPMDTNRKITIQWPAAITADALKSTERHQILNAAGVLSKQTWAAKEELSFADEQQNFGEDAETALMAAGGAEVASVGEARTAALAVLADLDGLTEARESDSPEAATRRGHIREFAESVQTWLAVLAQEA